MMKMPLFLKDETSNKTKDITFKQRIEINLYNRR